ncbi:MAG: hypothetical protein ACXAE3_04350 [Candidatus Kariarchaeaceae archaeon]|jgi:hypothetical protein
MTTALSFIQKEQTFVEGNKQGENVVATLTVDESQKKATLSFTADATLIIRRTASRQAESVVKSGFMLASGERVGMGYELEVLEGDKLGEAHLREGHKYNRI